MLENSFKSEFIEEHRAHIKMYQDAPERPNTKFELDKPKDIQDYIDGNKVPALAGGDRGGNSGSGSGSGGPGGGGDGSSGGSSSGGSKRISAD